MGMNVWGTGRQTKQNLQQQKKNTKFIATSFFSKYLWRPPTGRVEFFPCRLLLEKFISPEDTQKMAKQLLNKGLTDFTLHVGRCLRLFTGINLHRFSGSSFGLFNFC